MKILFVSFYFPPDLCAGSFRAAALVQALSERMGENDEIDVVTTLPNRYATFTVNAPEREANGCVRIRRCRIPSHRSGMMDQSRAYMRFAVGVWNEVVGRKYDLVFATTSRLMTGVLGALIARKMNTPLYLDIRDIFPDTMASLMAGRPLSLALPVFRWMERFAVQTATRVNLVSEGFRSYFNKISDPRKYAFFPNGIDEEFISYNFQKISSEGPPLVLYAGNIGAGQGLHRIIPYVAKRLENECRFLIVGDGGMRHELEARLEEMDVTNVQLSNPVNRFELLGLYAQADYLLLHLNDHEAFRKVLPSKIFEYAATGKPVLAGVSGYAARFIQEHVPGSEVFGPCDVEGFIEAVRRRPIDGTRRDAFIERFDRRRIMREFADDILRVTAGGEIGHGPR